MAGKISWDAVYAQQLPRVYNYFRFRLGRDDDAEELTSRTFEKAWRSRHRYRQELAGVQTWLFRIAQNCAIDHLRSRRAHVPLEAAADVATEQTPESQAALRSDLERLAGLTRALPERERELVALKYGASLTNRDIAKLTGLGESNVGTLLHRTVTALRAKW